MRLLKCDNTILLCEEEKQHNLDVSRFVTCFLMAILHRVFLIEKAVTEMSFAHFPRHTYFE